MFTGDQKLACGHLCSYSCHSGLCSSVNSCSQLVSVRCGCKRINKELSCHEINTIKNYRLPCDEICMELKKNRMATTSNSLNVQSIVEESKSSVEIDNSITNRKNQKNTNIEKTTINNRSSSVKKPKPRRFVWTSNKVILLFFLFSMNTVTIPDNQLNILANKTAVDHYMRIFGDYLDVRELSQI
ncbi:unnamed protein product [Rotaria sp. Silwood1]|nr:unnamed protein product [Rotaria sp. Silwood1]